MSTTNRAGNSRKRNALVDAPPQPQQKDQQPKSNQSAGQQPHELDEYALKRQRNNEAVNRTRQKKRLEQAHTSQRVKELREENTKLERTLDTMRRELALLKEMVVVCAAKGDNTSSSTASAANTSKKGTDEHQ